jgi:hypothetical protein
MIDRRFGRFAALAVAVLVPSALCAEVPFTPAKGGYTIVFPDKPQEKEVSLSPDVKETVYSVNRDDAAFLAGFTEYTQDMDIEKELVGDVQSFVTSLPAQLTERKRTMVKLANGTMVQQVEFTFEGEKSAGRGVAVMMTPRSSIMVAGLAMKPAGKPADVDEFVKSFKLAGQ